MTAPIMLLAVTMGSGAVVGAASTSDPGAWTDFITKGGAIAVFALVFWALLTGKLWIGRTVDLALKAKDEQIAALAADRDYWRNVSMETMRPLAERALSLAEQATKITAGAGVSGDAA